MKIGQGFSLPEAALDAHSTRGYRRTRSGLYVPGTRRRQRGRPRAADIFAGCGGFSLGMQQAGLNVVAAVEWDVDAAQAYLSNLGSVYGCAVAYVDEPDRARLAKALKRGKVQEGWVGQHNPDLDGSGCRAFVLGDATKVTGELIRSTLAAIGEDPTIEVVCGGPPCQGMSTAGRQDPADPRNNLVLEFVRIADELRASVFCMENVPPLLTAKKFRPLFDSLVARAREAGFDVVANVLDAVNYGVPQYRRRAFVVGTRGEAKRRPFSFAMPTHWSFGATDSKRWSFLHDQGDGHNQPTRGDTLPLFDGADE